MERYKRQVALAEIGIEGQELIRKSRVVIMGCGALGAMNASLLARAGIGRLILVDRDIVRVENLHRQVLFDENDAEEGLPKAVAAARALRKANSTIEVTDVVADVDHTNVLELIAGANAVVDGADNFELRYLVNEACVKLGVPFVFGAVLGTYGVQMTVVPREGPCLWCILPEIPRPGSVPTCESVGVLGTAVALVAALQATETLKVVTRRKSRLRGTLLGIDVWTGEHAEVRVERNEKCLVCGQERYELLEGRVGQRSEVLCGQEAVQIRLAAQPCDFSEIEARLGACCRLQKNPYMLQFEAEGLVITLFRDGRAIVRGTGDPVLAKSVLARWLGV